MQIPNIYLYNIIGQNKKNTTYLYHTNSGYNATQANHSAII
jgi:hypothetical protein